MLCRFVYLFVGRCLDVLSGRFRSRLAKEVEIAVLRHQVDVLRRQVSRLDLEPADRAVLALLSRLLPRARWSAFVVTSATILRWHRDLVRRRWILWGAITQSLRRDPPDCAGSLASRPRLRLGGSRGFGHLRVGASGSRTRRA